MCLCLYEKFKHPAILFNHLQVKVTTARSDHVYMHRVVFSRFAHICTMYVMYKRYSVDVC